MRSAPRILPIGSILCLAILTAIGGHSRAQDVRFEPDPRPGGMSPPLRPTQPISSVQGRQINQQSIRSADLGLWFDRATEGGPVINDIGTGSITQFGFQEGDRVLTVNGTPIDSELGFVRTLLDPRLRDQRVNVVVERFGQPWTVQ